MRIFLLFISLTLSSLSPADEYYFAVKGGVSLGSYEAGYNWMLIDELKRQARSGGDSLKVLSGASAGAINTILSVLEYCNADTATPRDAYFNNRFRKGWDIDIEELLPTKQKKTNKTDPVDASANGKILQRILKNIDDDEGAIYFKDRGSLLSRDPFIDKINQIEDDVLNKRYLKSCNGLSLTFSVTRFIPEQISLGKGEEPIKISRFVIPLEVVIDNGRLYFKNHYQIKNDNKNAVLTKSGIPIFHHIYLPETEDRRVPIFQIIKASLASSAFPVAFSPVDLSYCKSELECSRGEYESALFSDGGLFDNAPIGAASEQLLQQADLDSNFNPKKVKVVYIDPANRRSYDINSEKITGNGRGKIGIAAYINYFADAMNVGMNQELYRAKVRLISKNIRLYTSSRRYPLAGNFHMHFSAFYSDDFRAHDYLIGLYDAAHDLVRIRCNQQKNVTQSSCIKNRLHELLLSVVHIDENMNSSTQNAANFIDYLFADEFGTCISRKNSGGCSVINPDQTDKIIDNPYQIISLSLRRHHYQQTKPVRIIEDEEVFTDFINRLSAYNQRAGNVLSKSSEAIIASSDIWLARKGDILYKRLLQNQAVAADENFGMDLTIRTILNASEPTVDTILTQRQAGYWPLSPLPFSQLNASLYYGFDMGEYAQVFTFRGMRIPLMEKMSIEFPVTYHRMSKARESDHYFSGGPAIMYHIDNYGLSSFEIGYEISGKGTRYYNESTRALSIGVGLLGEGIRIQFQRRAENINASYSPTEIRTMNQIMFKVDLFKSLKTVFRAL